MSTIICTNGNRRFKCDGCRKLISPKKEGLHTSIYPDGAKDFCSAKCQDNYWKKYSESIFDYVKRVGLNPYSDTGVLSNKRDAI